SRWWAARGRPRPPSAAECPDEVSESSYFETSPFRWAWSALEEVLHRRGEGIRLLEEWKVSALLEDQEAGAGNGLRHLVGGERGDVHVEAAGHHQGRDLELADLRIEVVAGEVAVERGVHLPLEGGGVPRLEECVPLLRGVEEGAQVLLDRRIRGGLVAQLGGEAEGVLPLHRLRVDL